MSDRQNDRNNLVEPFNAYKKGYSHDKNATLIVIQEQMGGTDGAIATLILNPLQSISCDK